MSSISHLHATPLRRIDHGAALALVQTIHRHLEPEALVRTLWEQAAALLPVTGLRYSQARQDIEIEYGDGRHTARYNLDYEGDDLGAVELRFAARIAEDVLERAEDLLSLTVPALRNALSHHELRRQLARVERARAQAEQTVAASRGEAMASSARAAAATDALLLISLDGFDEMLASRGETWSQGLIQRLQVQIHEGLREADSVFQIDEGLLAVLLPGTPEDAALDVAARLRVLIAGMHVEADNSGAQLSACMGVVGTVGVIEPELVLSRARAALTDARGNGASSIRAYRPPAH